MEHTCEHLDYYTDKQLQNILIHFPKEIAEAIERGMKSSKGENGDKIPSTFGSPEIAQRVKELQEKLSLQVDLGVSEMTE